MPVLAVNHHYFRDTGPGKGIYPITPVALRQQVSLVRKKWRMGDESDVVRFSHGEMSPNDYVCIFTFDDGLKEQLSAIRLLGDQGATAICFVPTAAIIQRTVLNVHKLHLIRSVRSDEELSIQLSKRFDFESYEFDDELLAVQYRYDKPISRRVKYFLNFVLEKLEQDMWISELFIDIFGTESAVSEKLYMNVDELNYLAKRNILGTHAHTHVPLSTLSAQKCEAEIEVSVGTLQDLTNYKVKGISYPFGGKSAVSDMVFSLSKKLGLDYGFTMERGINLNQGFNPLALKRIDTNDLKQWINEQ
mgnify:CR=1 FL=1